MTRSITVYLLKIVLLALLLPFVLSCKKPDNTNRIRPATMLSAEDEHKQQFDVYYNILKDKKPWHFPAASYMNTSASYNGYGHLNYTITINNSVIRNDTIYYDILEIYLNNVNPGPSYRTFEDNNISVFYTTGKKNQIYQRVPDHNNPNPKMHGFINIISKTSKRVRLDISIATYGDYSPFSGTKQSGTPHTFKGELDFNANNGY